MMGPRRCEFSSKQLMLKNEASGDQETVVQLRGTMRRALDLKCLQNVVLSVMVGAHGNH